MGYSDIGSYGGEIETPVLDARQKGLRLTNYYVHNMCWPTRASIMTGLYPNSSLADGSAAVGLTQERHCSEALKSAGYGTYMAGKWHLSDPAHERPSAPIIEGSTAHSTYWGTSDFFAPVDLNLNGEDREFEWRGNPEFTTRIRLRITHLDFGRTQACQRKSSPFTLPTMLLTGRFMLGPKTSSDTKAAILWAGIPQTAPLSTHARTGDHR